jgi:hypothetical protein
MLNRTSFMRLFAAITRDAAFAYSCYAFIPPNLPLEIWTPRVEELDADEDGESDRVRPPRSHRSHSKWEIAAGQGSRVGSI